MKKGFLNVIAIISFLVAFLLIPKNTYALTFTAEKSVDTIKPGQDVTVYIKASNIGNDSISNYSINLNYDASKLDVKDRNGNGVSNVGTSNPINITSASGTLTDGTTVATIVFTAKGNAKAGDVSFAISGGDATTISSSTIKTSEIEWKSTMVKVAGFSSDATLSSLKIPNATISPKFDKNVTEYETTIQDITEITVNAVASDSNAKIMISENYKSLQKGENEIKITVTAEDGKSTKTYIIKVTLKLTPTEEELLKANANLKDLQVDGYKLEFTKELKKYSLIVPYKITKVNILAEAENPNAMIQMQGNTSLKVGRNTIKILVTSEDQANNETYTLTVTRSKQEKKVVQTCPDTTSSREWVIFSIGMFMTFTLGIILGYFLCRKEVLKKIFKHKKKEKAKEEELSNTIEIKPVKEEKKNEKKD